jgi:hypothetical protein
MPSRDRVQQRKWKKSEREPNPSRKILQKATLTSGGRTNFHAVPGDLSLSEANELLVSPILHAPGPEIQHSDPVTTSLNLPQEFLPE